MKAMFKNCINDINTYIVKAKKEGDTWHPSCLIPFHLMPNLFRNQEEMTLYTMGMYLSQWSLSKRIYNFESEIFRALAEQPFKAELPIEQLLTPPDYAVAVSLLVETEMNESYHTNVLFIIDQSALGEHQLVILVLVDGKPITESNVVRLPLIKGMTIEQSISSVYKQAKARAKSPQEIEKMELELKADINLIEATLPFYLYLCSDEPDIADHQQQTITRIGKPTRQKQRGGVKFVEAKKITDLFVGNKLQRSIATHQTINHENARTVTPHMRRAHWHGFWRYNEARDAKELFYKWIPPTPVNIKN